MKRPGIAAALCGALGLVLIAGVLLLSLPLALPRLLGYQTYTIVSGSMEPAIPTGSLVWAKTADPAALVPGDVVVYATGAAAPVTHRVVQNDTDSAALITKGDANDAPDLAPVPYRDVVGRVALHLPWLGLFLPAFATAAGKASLLGLLAAGLLFRALAARLRGPTQKGTRP